MVIEGVTTTKFGISGTATAAMAMPNDVQKQLIRTPIFSLQINVEIVKVSTSKRS